MSFMSRHSVEHMCLSCPEFTISWLRASSPGAAPRAGLPHRWCRDSWRWTSPQWAYLWHWGCAGWCSTWWWQTRGRNKCLKRKAERGSETSPRKDQETSDEIKTKSHALKRRRQIHRSGCPPNESYILQTKKSKAQRSASSVQDLRLIIFQIAKGDHIHPHLNLKNNTMYKIENTKYL